MAVDPGFSRRTSSERDLQPVAITAVDPASRTAYGTTRVRHTILINCAYATGETLTVPAVGEQWYVERFDMEWRLYGRIPFNDATLNIEPVEGQVSVGSASGPLELNGTEVRANGTLRLGGFYYRDDGTTLQRSADGQTWQSIVASDPQAASLAAETAQAAAAQVAQAVTGDPGADLQKLSTWSTDLAQLTSTANTGVSDLTTTTETLTGTVSAVQTIATTAQASSAVANTNHTTLLGNLLNNAGTVIGNIAGVVMDGIESVGFFLNNLWESLTGQTGTGKKIAEVTAAASGVTSTANNASSSATAAKSTADTLIDHVANSLTGSEEVSGRVLSEALDAMVRTYITLSNNTRAIQELQAAKTGQAVKGTHVSIDFSQYPNGDMPSPFTVSYSGPGTSTIGIQNGVACWRNTNNANRDAKIVYGSPTSTDFQIIRGTMSTAPEEGGSGGVPKFHAIGRVSDDTNSYVWARAYCIGWFTYRGEIGCTVDGVETTWVSNIPLTWSLDMTFVLGVGTNPRQYQVFSGGTLVHTHTESGTASMLGSGYRKWGAIAQIRSASGNPRHSGKVAGTSVADNESPQVNGSAARMYRTGTDSETFAGGNVNTPLPDGFFSNVAYESPDIDANTADGTFTVGESKPYVITGRVRISADMLFLSLVGIVLQHKPLGGSWSTVQYGEIEFEPRQTTGLTGHWIQYLNAGDQVRLATRHSGGTVTTLTGSSDGIQTYFAIAGAG